MIWLLNVAESQIRTTENTDDTEERQGARAYE